MYLDFKIYISYFAQIRNFPRTLVPFSTAMWNPKWYTYRTDNRGVLLGIKIPELSPAKLESQDCIGCDKSLNGNCNFTKSYREYLNTVDFDSVISHISNVINKVNQFYKRNHDACLMVYETPWNPCSERQSLIDYFKCNGIEIIEFTG